MACLADEKQTVLDSRVDSAVLEGIDHDEGLWHNRRPSVELIHEHAEEAAAQSEQKGGGQGLLTGVIFPCMSNILGVILFLRAPWIVGKAGVLNALGLVSICCTCTFLTSLSLSAIATNGKILGGGAYYLISRSLGPALGAGVGLCFYIANSIGAAMYLIGTVEAWEMARPQSQILEVGDINNIRVTAFCLLAACLVIVGGGIKYVVRLGTVFLFIVLFVILCMYLGCLVGPDQAGTSPSSYAVEIALPSGATVTRDLFWGGAARAGEYLKENWGPGWDKEQLAYPADKATYTFISMMGLWFPANTGIMAGSNRSADLRDPSGDIPKGTLFAQLFTSIVYLSFIFLYGCVAPRQTLLDDRFFASIATWPAKEVVIYGVMASTIGAGLTSLVSGTRLLSAIASDKTLPILRFFAAPPGKEPRLALAASGMLCACAIAIGELNAVAPILTMFFLMCYTCVNASCLVSEAVQDPNWRPRFRFHHWAVSLLGTLLCIWMMFAMDAVKAIIAVLFCGIVMTYSAYNSHAVKWGDGFQGMKFQVARNILMKMDVTAHTKNWRPQLLVVTEASVREEEGRDGAKRQQLHFQDTELLKLVSQLKGGRGITILGGVCSSCGVDALSDSRGFVAPGEQKAVFDGQDAMRKVLAEHQIEGFGKLVYSKSFLDGVHGLVQTAGLGAFQPNCIMSSWPSKEEWSDTGRAGFLARSHVIRTVQTAVSFHKAMLIAKSSEWPRLTTKLGGNIDIWWIVGDGGILLLLPFLLKKHKVWQGCRTRLFVLTDKVGTDPAGMAEELKAYVKDFRLEVEVHIKVLEAAQIKRMVSHELPFVLGSAPSSNDPQHGVPQRDLEPQPTRAAERPPAPCTRMPQVGRARSLDMLGSLLTCFGLGSAMAFGTGDAKESAKGAAPAGELGLRGDILPKQPPPPGAASAQRSISEPPAPPSPREFTRQVSPLDLSRQISDPAVLNHWLENTLTARSADALRRDCSGQGQQPSNTFAGTHDQMISVSPCSATELGVSSALGEVIHEESKDADLVVTNLPDMPPGESAFGYFQVVEEITKGLKRCILVRGTASEVIAQFT